MTDCGRFLRPHRGRLSNGFLPVRSCCLQDEQARQWHPIAALHVPYSFTSPTYPGPVDAFQYKHLFQHSWEMNFVMASTVGGQCGPTQRHRREFRLELSGELSRAEKANAHTPQKLTKAS